MPFLVFKMHQGRWGTGRLRQSKLCNPTQLRAVEFSLAGGWTAGEGGSGLWNSPWLDAEQLQG